MPPKQKHVPKTKEKTKSKHKNKNILKTMNPPPKKNAKQTTIRVPTCTIHETGQKNRLCHTKRNKTKNKNKKKFPRNKTKKKQTKTQKQKNKNDYKTNYKPRAGASPPESSTKQNN